MQKKSYLYSSKCEEKILKFRKVKVSSKHFIPGDTHSRIRSRCMFVCIIQHINWIAKEKEYG